MEEFIPYVMDILEAKSDEPCSVCGEEGDTLPCLVCDKLICGECGDGTRWCNEHAPEPKGAL